MSQPRLALIALLAAVVAVTPLAIDMYLPAMPQITAQLATTPGRDFGSADPGRPANVHIRVDGWPGQQFALLFPVWLAANPDERVEYLALKHDAMAAAPATSGEYADAKEPWLAGAYRRAWAWADQTGWRT